MCAAGDVQAGDLGLGAVPGREAEFRQGLDLALDYARALSCKRWSVKQVFLPHHLELWTVRLWLTLWPSTQPYIKHLRTLSSHTNFDFERIYHVKRLHPYVHVFTRIHLMAGRVPVGSQRSTVAREMENTFIQNLQYAADVLSKVSGLLCPRGSRGADQVTV